MIPRCVCLFAIGSLVLAPIAAQDPAAFDPPRTLILDGRGMAGQYARWRASGDTVHPAIEDLRREADECLTEGPWTVVSKTMVPPSGDKHDYISVGPYWWPDPDKPDGKPYIRRDGQVNPERMEYDNVGLKKTCGNGLTLALAWYYTRNPDYSRHGAELLRTWFIRPETAMNANLNFGQAIPGRTKGRGIGIIDTACLIGAVDAALLLETSAAWTDADARSLRQWFAQYLHWLRNSKHGRDEDRTKNNHATWYDAQVACFALYAGQPDVARNVLRNVAERRIDSQIRVDGSQPHELTRTKSWDYSVMNLKAFFHLATLADHVDINLWHHDSANAGGIRDALDFLIPFARSEKDWQHEQITPLDGSKLAELVRRASIAYDEPKYESVLRRLFSEDQLATARFQLIYPGGRANDDS
ncbi:alginate lyase family protein [Stieleria mannarensis]|uniref:alginate lyase family protein n=1 Tax=Stieleria mannarensis TaxID=2755585 RepID=UPI0015FF5F71|nr:alginate lyase family protein [Rhodopirellula sp. JC639]